MDQIKIGRFISQCRKDNGMTQMQLAERLGVTDRAVSKWETGRAMPDSSIMLELCKQLKITVNDLLCGEVVSMENYNKELEKNLLDMAKAKEKADKQLLLVEVIVAVLSLTVFFALIFVAFLVQIEEWLQTVLILIGFAPVLIATPFMLRIEQNAGYYECRKCGHRYVPKYMPVFLAMHMGRTRYMKCPECNKRSWQKKVLTKEK